MGCSVNPIDTKVRAHRYDDNPDYYDRTPKPFQIMGYDGAGVIEQVGIECKYFKPGQAVFYACNPIKQGSNSEFQLVDERSCAVKPERLDFVEAAAMPLTFCTAWEALLERLEIQEGEKAGLLIINGAGGVGAIATQIAREVLKLPAVVTTASRPDTVAFTKSMGATHVVNHRQNIIPQIEELRLDVPIKYIFITHSTDQYMNACAEICAPFGKVCTIVQAQAHMYGTRFMSKSLSFCWCVLSTRSYWGVDLDGHHRILTILKDLLERRIIRCPLTKRLPMTLEGIKESHRLTELSKNIGKVGLGAEEASGKPLFA